MMDKKNMNREKVDVFKEELMTRLEKELQMTEIDFIEMNQKNGIVEDRIRIKMGVKYFVGSSIDQLYLHYKNADMAACVRLVKNQLEHAKTVDAKQFFGTWEDASRRIVPELVNTKWNEALLQNVIHKPFLDLSIILRLYGDSDAVGRRPTMILTKSMLERLWEEPVSEETVWEAAYKNLEELQFASISLETVLKEAKGVLGDLEIPDFPEEPQEPEVYAILISKHQVFGAIALLRTDLWEKMLQDLKCEKVYLIPESVESILAVPDYGKRTPESLEKMLREVNEEVLEKELWLSDHLYCYSRSTGKVEPAIKSC